MQGHLETEADCRLLGQAEPALSGNRSPTTGPMWGRDTGFTGGERTDGQPQGDHEDDVGDLEQRGQDELGVVHAQRRRVQHQPVSRAQALAWPRTHHS